MRTSLFCFLVLGAALPAWSQRVPDRHIPPSVLMEVQLLDGQFKAALSSDCAPDRCFPKGCVYANHLTLDQPRTSSLPGLPSDEGPGSVVPQEYLTQARCEFSHEKTVRTRDVQSLVRRLEKRLSRGWLKVSVTPEVLEPIPKSLAETQEDKPEDKPEEEPEATPPVAPEPDELTSKVALQELWDSLLPHFPWMVAIILVTISIFLIIWAGRRLGAQSMEDRLLEAQMANAEPPEPEVESPDEPVATEAQVKEHEDEDFAAQQEALWASRIERVSKDDDDVIARLLREWLKAGEYPTLARALFVFGDQVSHAFESDPELALKKVEFAEYFRDVEEAELPSRAKFFRRLNQQAMASLLLSQEDVQLYRSLREDFGSSGVLGLMRGMPQRHSAILFALVPRETQYDVAKLMPVESRAQVAAQLLSSTRMSREESEYLFACVGAARDGQALPEAPKRGAVRDRGPEVDSASALSVLLPHVAADQRAALFAQALERNGGSAPAWYEDIVFNHMLSAVPEEQRNDLLLDVDIRSLGAWLSMQQAPWRDAFVAELTASLQNALRQSSSFGSRADQIRLAGRGHAELVAALKSSYARGRTRFIDLVS